MSAAIQVRLPPSLQERLTRMSEQTGLTRTLLIRRALEEFLVRVEAEGQVVFEAVPLAGIPAAEGGGSAYPAAKSRAARLNETAVGAANCQAAQQTPVPARASKGGLATRGSTQTVAIDGVEGASQAGGGEARTRLGHRSAGASRPGNVREASSGGSS